MIQKILPSSPLSKKTLVLGMGIIASALFSRQLLEFFRSLVGRRMMVIGEGGFFAAFGSIFFLKLFLRSPGIVRKIILIVVSLFLAHFSWQLRIIEERIHLVEYAVLSWFAAADFSRNKGRNSAAILAGVLFAFMVGVLDETFQKILPYRVFDIRDIGFNGIGSLVGGILYFNKGTEST